MSSRNNRFDITFPKDVPEETFPLVTIDELEAKRKILIEDLHIIQIAINEINDRRNSPYDDDMKELARLNARWVSKNKEVLDIDKKISAHNDSLN